MNLDGLNELIRTLEEASDYVFELELKRRMNDHRCQLQLIVNDLEYEAVSA